MKYLILGAGWYGCYLGMIFKILGLDFIILEKNSDIFTGSSSKNQNRLHMGFHYPRSKETRDECKKGWNIFNKIFKYLTLGITNNYYLIDTKSKIPYNQYVETYKNEGYDFTEIQNLYNIETNTSKIAGILRCDEQIIKHNKAYEFFKHMLKDKIIFNYNENDLTYKDKILFNNVEYDYLINCTYGQALKDTFDTNNMEYELCISFIYESLNNTIIDHSITVMDGNYFSIYPYYSTGNNKFVVTSVEHTPIMKSNDFNKLIEYEKNLNQNDINIIKNNVEKKVLEYIPTFNKLFKYNSYYISYKCKFTNQNDDRSLKCIQKNKIFNIIGGKITGIFSMIEILFSKIKELSEINQKYIKNDKLVVANTLNIFSCYRKLTDVEINHHCKNTKKYKHILDFIYEIITCDEFKYRYVVPIMKIAVCFFGYTRDIEKNYKTHANLLKLNPDIFIHTYTSSGKKSNARYRGGTWINKDELTNIIDIDFIKNKYNPKKILIENNNLDSFSIDDGRIIPVLIYQAHDDATKYINSQLYTKYITCTLKKSYEMENKFNYDIVILTRFDFGFEFLSIKDLLDLDMSRIYFPGYNSHHAHPGKGGGCLSCDSNKYHFGSSHTNDMCDVWAISYSSNIDTVGNLYVNAKNILHNTRYNSNDYIIKNNIKYKKDKNFIYVYEKFEDDKLVCYYPERLLREYLKNNICLTYNNIYGRINVAIN